MRKVLGLVLAASPFIVVVGMASQSLGMWATLRLCAMAVAAVVIVWAGLWLLMEDDDV